MLGPITPALPGWTGYLGTFQQTQALQNGYSTGEVVRDIFGPNYTAARPASSAQAGTIPLAAQSMQFKAWFRSRAAARQGFG